MIEIEKKFLLTDAQRADLLAGAEPLGTKQVEDSYLDTEDFSLTKKDYWFRIRDGEYELKAPLSTGRGTYATTNRYNEITDVEEIRHELQLDEGNFADVLAAAGIKKFITVYTNRTSYEKAGFHLDLDTATYADSDFEYAVAEIESLIEDENGADEAEANIIEFAKQFALTTDQVILGKVAAFLKEKRPEHYEALVATGVLTKV